MDTRDVRPTLGRRQIAVDDLGRVGDDEHALARVVDHEAELVVARDHDMLAPSQAAALAHVDGQGDRDQIIVLVRVRL